MYRNVWKVLHSWAVKCSNTTTEWLLPQDEQHRAIEHDWEGLIVSAISRQYTKLVVITINNDHAKLVKLFWSTNVRSWCSSNWSFMLSKTWYRRQSSANSLQRVSGWTMSGRSLIWSRKSRGPSTVPWGTPDKTSASSLLSPSTMTDCLRPVRKAEIQRWTSPVMPNCSILPRSLLWDTVSKGFEKSKMATSICLALSLSLRMSWVVGRSWVSHECLLNCWYW